MSAECERCGSDLVGTQWSEGGLHCPRCGLSAENAALRARVVQVEGALTRLREAAYWYGSSRSKKRPKKVELAKGDDIFVALREVDSALAASADPSVLRGVRWALYELARCESPQHTEAEFVTREMAIAASEPTMEGTRLRGEVWEPCGACAGCQGQTALARMDEAYPWLAESGSEEGE